MAHLLTFRTSKFDVTAETPNPNNPIAGQSVLKWLQAELAKNRCNSTDPDTEDWGWYMHVECNGTSYLVGASADAEDSAKEVEWVVQVHKQRSLKEKLLGRNKMSGDDPLFARVEQIARAERELSNVSVQRDA
jgi:hypothetical protein